MIQCDNYSEPLLAPPAAALEKEEEVNGKV
jgi:hypothetical protein